MSKGSIVIIVGVLATIALVSYFYWDATKPNDSKNVKEDVVTDVVNEVPENTAPVEIYALQFNEAYVTIPVGASVQWTNKEDLDHTVTADDGTFDSGVLKKGEKFTYTFDKKGTYTYKCTLHTTMTGVVTVE